MMAKNIRRILSIFMVLSVFASTLSLQALAAEDGTTTTTEDGIVITTTQTTTTTEDGDNTTVTVTIEKTAEGTNSAGEKVQSSETTVTTTTTDANGYEVGNSWTVDGYEKKEWTEEDSGDEPGQPEVNVGMIPGQTTTGTASTTETTGDINGADGETTTTTTDRTVNVETSDINVSVNESNSGLVGEQDAGLVGIPPVVDVIDGVKENKEGVFDRNFLSTNTNIDTSKWTDIPPEGEYRYVGTGEHSKYFVGLLKVIYKKENGVTVYDEDGNPVIEKIVNKVSGADVLVDGKVADKIYEEHEYDEGFSSSRAQNFMLMDKNGNRVYVYCCDADTGANPGYWYSVSNLEDSEYYTPDAEEHIRAIALNGYWGTSDVPAEDGSYEFGSLEGIKAKLMEAIDNGVIDRYAKVPVRDTSTSGAGKIQVDENGDPIYYEDEVDLLEIIGDLTEGEALLATQAAIWSFANGSKGATSGIDGAVVVTPDWYRNHQLDYSKHEKEPLDDAAGVRVTTLYNWLMSLTEEEGSSIVINDKNFIEDMSITVQDKDAEHENNQDENNDNDVYNTDLNFKLAFIPGDKDDLLVQISYTDIDGNEVTLIKRLAGTNAEGQSYESILPEEDGSYVLKGLKLSENEDFGFDLRLEGTQYLEHGVYVYSAVGGRDASQTFVGVAEGTRNVDISVGMTIKFDVDENNHVVAERVWHDENDPVMDPPAENDGPVIFEVEPTDGLVEIPEEDVPLAEAPQTGDMIAPIAICIIMLAGLALAALKLSEKKRNTTF